MKILSVTIWGASFADLAEPTPPACSANFEGVFHLVAPFVALLGARQAALGGHGSHVSCALPAPLTFRISSTTLSPSGVSA
jgi:hypothetical protein